MRAASKQKKHKLTKENWTGLAFIAPAVILLFVFLFVPFVMTLGYSFTNYNILKPDAMKFVGLKNFIKLAQDTVFRKSIINTSEKHFNPVNGFFEFISRVRKRISSIRYTISRICKIIDPILISINPLFTSVFKYWVVT